MGNEMVLLLHHKQIVLMHLTFPLKIEYNILYIYNKNTFSNKSALEIIKKKKRMEKLGKMHGEQWLCRFVCVHTNADRKKQIHFHDLLAKSMCIFLCGSFNLIYSL